MSNDNKTPYKSELYDTHVLETLPYYTSYHIETINLVKSLSKEPDIWLDTGCGTGTMVKIALEHFRHTKFFIVDPSEGMLDEARDKLINNSDNHLKPRVKILKPSPTQEFSQEFEKSPDIITAIQCHHYLNNDDRKKAVKVCYENLKEGGIFVTFENIRPLTEKGVKIGKENWKNFQLARGKDNEEVNQHLSRFDSEYFPLTIEEHLKLLRETGFETVELLWYSYMQAGFYAIK